MTSLEDQLDPAVVEALRQRTRHETRDEYAQRHREEGMDMFNRARRAQQAVNDILTGAQTSSENKSRNADIERMSAARAHGYDLPTDTDTGVLAEIARLGGLLAQREEDSERVTDVAVIGFGGYYGCGKDAAADHLVAHRDFEKRYFSEPLHEWLLVQNPWIKLDQPVRSLEGWLYDAGEFVRYAWLDYHVGYVKAKEQQEVRALLQATGTQAGRRLIHEDIWADRMYVLTKKRIEELKHVTRTRISADGERELTDVRIVITGVRYPNELEAIRKLGGTAIWIDRPSATAAHERRVKEDSERVTQGLPPLVHESDLMLTAQHFDTTIMNDGDLAQLHERVEAWFDSRF